MSAGLCRTTWAEAGPNEKAPRIDEAFPACACEAWSLVGDDCDGISDEEILARILTTPGAYDLSTGELLTAKLTGAWAGGVSLVRHGASDAEILETIRQLVHDAADDQSLLGAAVFTKGDIASLGAPTRHFGVYHTPVSGKIAHADILGTTPEGTNSQKDKQKRLRRRDIRNLMQPKILFESDPAALLARLRQAGL